MSVVEEALRKLDLAQHPRLDQLSSDAWPTHPVRAKNESALSRQTLIFLVLVGVVITLSFMLFRAQTASRVDPLASAVAVGTTATPSAQQLPISPPMASPGLVGATEQAQVTATLMQWATAWSQKDVAGYLGFYSGTFSVPEGASLANWQAKRQARISKPRFIKVTLKALQVRLASDGMATVNLVQDYTADNFREMGVRKEIRLQKEGGKWLILKESLR